jgi:signal peptidase II
MTKRVMFGFLICAVAVLALVSADLLIKDWAVTVLAPVSSMDILKIGDFDIVGLRYTENTGAAFSIFEDSRVFLIVLVSILLIGLTIYGLADKDKSTFKSACLVMIIAGGLGNLIDRIRNGYVIDYIELRFMRFAIFNFADILAVCGCILLFLYVVFFEEKRRKHNRDSVRRRRIRREIDHYGR